MRIFLKTLNFSTQILELVAFYQKVLTKKIVIFYKHKSYNLFSGNLLITRPQRQQHFTFFSLRHERLFHYSAGVLLARIVKVTKFFKRSDKNFISLITFLKKKFLIHKKKFFFCFFKNFTYTQFIFLQKIFEFTILQACYLVLTKPYNTTFKYKKRIKRRVLRLVLR